MPHRLTKPTFSGELPGPASPATVAQPLKANAAPGAKEETLDLRSIKFYTEKVLPETQTQVVSQTHLIRTAIDSITALMLQVPVYHASPAPSVPHVGSISNSPEFSEADSHSPYQSYKFKSSSPESNAVEDPSANTGYDEYQSSQAQPHLKLTRPIEVKPNRDFLRADGVVHGDVDFPSFDSEFRTLYGGAQEQHVG